MKVTKIRTNKNEVPSTDVILELEKMLLASMKKNGFISGVEIKTRSAIKIGMRMCSFRIDTAKLGHNADYSYCGRKCKTGYKKTNLPTWSQREDFNHMVNEIFDKLKLSANIKSGPYIIRDFTNGREYNWDPYINYYISDMVRQTPRVLEIKAIG